MTTVWKYELEMVDVQRVEMPQGATLLHVGNQYAGLCLWALVESSAPRCRRMIAVVGTGNPAPSAREGMYVGSAVIDPFVWHVFDGGEVAS